MIDRFHSNNKQKNALLEQIAKTKQSNPKALTELKLLSNPLIEAANKASEQIHRQVLIQANAIIKFLPILNPTCNVRTLSCIPI